MNYSKNDLCEVVITDMSETGEGIGKVDGYTLFVKDAIVGDRVSAQITKVKKNYAFARTSQVITASPDRIEAPCPVARPCGGCQIQAMSYDAQLRFKSAKVYGCLKRIGGFDDALLERIFEPIVGMDNPYRFRNKAQYPIGVSHDGDVIAGFYAGRTHSVIPCEDCLIGPAENKEILDIILGHMRKYGISAYNEINHKGLVRHVLIRKGFVTGQIMVCMVITEKGKKTSGKSEGVKKHIEYIPGQEKLLAELAKISGMTSICVSINPDDTNVIMGDEVHTLWGEDTIEDELIGNRFRISPLAFYQVNHAQCEKLYATACEFAELTGDEEVWDICCGIGTITLTMAPKCKTVHGIEIVPQAINDAKYNAALNKIENADFECADATLYLKENAGKISADVIVMDPPRKGMDEEALTVVADTSPARIVYVSCDPATLARDLKFLCERGYTLERVRPVDMFPHSVHIETVCLLCRKTP